MRKFTLMVPVEVVVREERVEQKRIWKDLQESGTSYVSVDSEAVQSYEIKTERIRWREFKAALEMAPST